ncbi:MAG: hypothetical protein AVDCRST_MAG32-2731, partial [uncultured Nocardioides sp.]
DVMVAGGGLGPPGRRVRRARQRLELPRPRLVRPARASRLPAPGRRLRRDVAAELRAADRRGRVVHPCRAGHDRMVGSGSPGRLGRGGPGVGLPVLRAPSVGRGRRVPGGRRGADVGSGGPGGTGLAVGSGGADAVRPVAQRGHGARGGLRPDGL